jgi:hypothetical protein
MVKSTALEMDELKNYANPKAKLTRLLKDGSLIPLRRGLYADTKATSPRVIATALYGPSYISFQYALAVQGLIPERVTTVTCASYGKNKNKVFRTPLGTYYYYYLPAEVYPLGVNQEVEDDASYLIASREKALCDLVYKTPSVVTFKGMESLLLEDWRIEKDDLLALDVDFIEKIAPLYHRRSLNALTAWFRRKGRAETENG